ncbi:MAG: metallophosphoesterase family protein [Planctomycetes bacterium]|nr:metallophosphoesterase family protein [Planctomycetota bacterium]
MIALISDLHSNMEAIRAVLADIERRGVERVICLGDVIGYGPEPRAALKLVDGWEACLRGNHEEAVLHVADDFNEKAKTALDWTRNQLNDSAVPKEERYALWAIIDRMLVEHRLDSALLVHGSPRDPIREYILPRDAQDAKMMGAIFELIDRKACFVGHSHVPGVYARSGGFRPPSECADGVRVAEGDKVLINVGSVGQPRDGDCRASYVTWDGETAFFHRVEYDVEATAQKILRANGLPRYLAERLKVGR